MAGGGLLREGPEKGRDDEPASDLDGERPARNGRDLPALRNQDLQDRQVLRRGRGDSPPARGSPVGAARAPGGGLDRKPAVSNWRRRPESNWGWRFCRPLPCHLATSPRPSSPDSTFAAANLREAPL